MREWGLAVAESCTGGLLGSVITSVPGSSEYFAGGVIAYSNQLKISLLGVSPELIALHGAVSQEVAMAMAHGVARVTGAPASIAITGVAGPAGSEQKPPGTVFVAVMGPCFSVCRQFTFEGNRGQVRAEAVKRAIDLFLSAAGEAAP